MLFAAAYRGKPNASEERDKRQLALLTSWQPPFEFKHHWARADQSAGIAIFEADSAAVVLEGIAPWNAYLDFEVSPIVAIEDAVPAIMKTNAWRDSVASTSQRFD